MPTRFSYRGAIFFLRRCMEGFTNPLARSQTSVRTPSSFERRVNLRSILSKDPSHSSSVTSSGLKPLAADTDLLPDYHPHQLPDRLLLYPKLGRIVKSLGAGVIDPELGDDSLGLVERNPIPLQDLH